MCTESQLSKLSHHPSIINHHAQSRERYFSFFFPLSPTHFLLGPSQLKREREREREDRRGRKKNNKNQTNAHIVGVLVECDPSIKAIILKIDHESHDYIIEDLDDETLVIKESMLPKLKARLDEVYLLLSPPSPSPSIHPPTGNICGFFFLNIQYF